ncbi:MAG: 50S ribosomal protein L29 [Candidatus Andersenbacteria bacterium]|nr:50S ribosomal protein L29 [Candidatus Andersenbacteria bacterium]
MKDKEFQQLTGAGLAARLEELRAEYYGAKAEVTSGKSKNTAALKLMRRRIARALTQLTGASGEVAK